MAKTCASNWKRVDAETKWYCDSVARILKIRHKALLKDPSSLQCKRPSVSLSASPLAQQPNFGLDRLNPVRTAQNHAPPPPFPIQEATKTNVRNQGYLRFSDGNELIMSSLCWQEPLPELSGERIATPESFFSTSQLDELSSEHQEEPIFRKLSSSDSEVDVSDDEIINAWFSFDC